MALEYKETVQGIRQQDAGHIGDGVADVVRKKHQQHEIKSVGQGGVETA